ncbi:MAG: AraC family transcriptional regulator ligand-binding domain-containing protein [Myxococcota bacterium]
MRHEHNKPVHVGNAWRIIFRDLKLDEQTVLRRAGLPTTLLDGEGTYVSLDDYYALHDAAEVESGDPTLALKAGAVVSVELFDPALFAALCSPDLNTAVTRLGQFKRLVGVFSLDVDIGDNETRVRYRCKRRPDIQRTRGLSELIFLVAFARRATRHHVIPVRFITQQLPDDLEPYEAYLGCELETGAEFAVCFAATDARRPFLTHNVKMWEVFEPALRRRMASANENRSIREQVEVALYELLPSGRSQISDVARTLGLGSRTLQRRLSAEDTTWLAVLNQTRERLARHYLKRTKLTPAEISFLLGFEDPNSLFRAFQRWTGTTPEAWRASAKNTPCYPNPPLSQSEDRHGRDP